MYKEHPSFDSIADSTKIWRFMDFSKFCVILEKSSLFFSKPECFEDPWEGFSTKTSLDLDRILLSNIIEQRPIQEIERERVSMIRSTTGVNCWYINDTESEAFWKNNSKSGIAIQSTFGRLKESFDKEQRYSVFIGKITYKDHYSEVIERGNMFYNILWKRKSFNYENELRAVVWAREATPLTASRPFDDVKGQNIEVDLNILIGNIYTTPFIVGVWFNNIVQDVIKKYGFSFECKKSTLMDIPNYLSNDKLTD